MTLLYHARRAVISHIDASSCTIYLKDSEDENSNRIHAYVMEAGQVCITYSYMLCVHVMESGQVFTTYFYMVSFACDCVHK